jgi:hypothetical protein
MDRSKLVAIITGVIALFLGIAYLLVVQLLDFRGEMIPAPQDFSHQKFTPPAPMVIALEKPQRNFA